MADGRSKRKPAVFRFLSALDKNRRVNFSELIARASKLKPIGLENPDWAADDWTITKGRLTKLAAKNQRSVTLKFRFSVKLGGKPLPGDWSLLCKALFLVRFHRRNQVSSNQANFIVAVGYVTYAALEQGLELLDITPEVLDRACQLLTRDYEETTAYNLHKAVMEFAAHLDANHLCKVFFHFKYAKLKRPENTGGVRYKRLDDPDSLVSDSEKLLDPAVFMLIGKLFVNVPSSHPHREYILILAILCCLGRRYAEVALLPDQAVATDRDGKKYIEVFGRKPSLGDTSTPSRRLYFPTEATPILEAAIQELHEICLPAREIAAEMLRTNGPDLRFLRDIAGDDKLYEKDLKALGLAWKMLSKGSWLKKNGFVYSEEPVGRRAPRIYTNRAGLEAYFQSQFQPQYVEPIHIDDKGKKYYLKDLLIVRVPRESARGQTHWLATQVTHSMLTTFLRGLPKLCEQYAPDVVADVDFTSHQFRHTLATLLDEGGLSDLLQTAWFLRRNPADTKAYQHTSPAKRVLMVREALLKGEARGHVASQLNLLPVTHREAFVVARVKAAHDVGAGMCVHHFAQTPCSRHLQCTADCEDFTWVKKDELRLPELKRQYAMAVLARRTALRASNEKFPRRSADWLAHNDKKLAVLELQLKESGIETFDVDQYLKEQEDDPAI